MNVFLENLKIQIKDILEQDGQFSIYKTIAETLNISNFKPELISHITKKELFSKKEEKYFVIRNDNEKTYLRLSDDDNSIVSTIDGTRSVNELLLEYFLKTKKLALKRIIELIRSLREKYFLKEKPIHAYHLLSLQLNNTRSKRILQKLKKLFFSYKIEFHKLDGLLSKLTTPLSHLVTNAVIRSGLLLFSCVGLIAFTYIFMTGEYNLFKVKTSYSLGYAFTFIINLAIVSIHELAHALTIKGYGRNINSAGFIFYFGCPCFYVDSSDMWLSDRKKRITVSLAGPYSTMLLGGLFSIIVYFFPEYTYNPTLFKLSFWCYISSLLNLNPLLELDGYYILIDYFEKPNLRKYSFQFIRNKLFPKIKNKEPFSREEKVYSAYGVLAFLWAIFATIVTVFLIKFRLHKIFTDVLQGHELLPKIVSIAVFIVLVLPVALSLLYLGLTLLKKILTYIFHLSVWKNNYAVLAAAFIALFSLDIILYVQALDCILPIIGLFYGMVFYFIFTYNVFFNFARFTYRYNFLAFFLCVNLIQFFLFFPNSLLISQLQLCLIQVVFLWMSYLFLVVKRFRFIGKAQVLLQQGMSENARLKRYVSFLVEFAFENIPRILNEKKVPIFVNDINEFSKKNNINLSIKANKLIFTESETSVFESKKTHIHFLMHFFKAIELHVGKNLVAHFLEEAYNKSPWVDREIAYEYFLKHLPYNIIKTKEASRDIFSLIANNPIFSDIEEEALRSILTYFNKKTYEPNELIIKKDEGGDTFFVIIEGEVLVYDIEHGEKKNITSLYKGDYFGEISLIKDIPRTAYIRAVEKTDVLTLTKAQFDTSIKPFIKGFERVSIKVETLSLIKQIPIFTELSNAQISELVKVMERQSFCPKDMIIREGEIGSVFYIIAEGKVLVTKKDKAGIEREITTLSKGEYFGEIALLLEVPRTSSIRAFSAVEVFSLKKEHFDALIKDNILSGEGLEMTSTRRMHELEIIGV